MPIQSLIPAIAFNGTCAKAIDLYTRALGAEVQHIVHFRDGAKMGHEFSAKDADLVLNAMLRIGAGTLMVMDAPPERRVPNESNLQVSIEFSDDAAVEKAFSALKEGGVAMMEPHDSFWGARFAMVKDAFGVGWMLAHTKTPG